MHYFLHGHDCRGLNLVFLLYISQQQQKKSIQKEKNGSYCQFSPPELKAALTGKMDLFASSAATYTGRADWIWAQYQHVNRFFNMHIHFNVGYFFARTHPVGRHICISCYSKDCNLLHTMCVGETCINGFPLLKNAMAKTISPLIKLHSSLSEKHQQRSIFATGQQLFWCCCKVKHSNSSSRYFQVCS